MTSVRVSRDSSRLAVVLEGRQVVPRLLSATAETARVALVAGGALLLGGDRVSIDIVVGEGCALELQDIGGTVAYDSDGVGSEWSVSVRLEAGASLSWAALPLVVATGANVRRTLTADLADDAVLCVRETIVLGRHGEMGGRVESHTEVTGLYLEHLSLDGSARQPGLAGSATVVDSVLLGGRRPEAGDDVLQFEGNGGLARYLGTEAHRSPLDSTYASWVRAARPVSHAKEAVDEVR